MDIERLKRGYNQVRVEGCVNGGAEREKCIEDAIAAIKSNPETALKREFIGLKNYAQFYDQRCDCQYGYGPRHGSICFRIERVDRGEAFVDEDAIYFLECERDWVPVTENTGRRELNLNVTDCMRKLLSAERDVETYRSALEQAEVEQLCVRTTT